MVFAKYFNDHDHPLLPSDLTVCQTTFDAICFEQGIDRQSAKASEMAALIIELYRQGVHDSAALQSLVGVAGEP